MKSLTDAIKTATLGENYAHLVEPPSLPGKATKVLYQWFCKIMLKVYCPLRVTGTENLPKPPFIFCSNHNSHMDSAILMVSSGMPFQKFGMVAATDYFFENGFRRRFLGSLMHLIPIDRKPNYHSIVELVVACREFMKTGGRNVIIFPEGTRSITGCIQKFKKGPAMIANELQLPIVPVYIEGTYEALPKGRCFLKPRKVRTFIGKPIYPNQVRLQESNHTLRLAYNQLTEMLQEAVKELKESSHATN